MLIDSNTDKPLYNWNNFRSCARHESGYYVMKKIVLTISALVVSAVVTISLSSFTSQLGQGTEIYNNTSQCGYVEVRGLKCPNHDYVKDGHHFMYKEVYPGSRPNAHTRCVRCGYTMSLHKPQK